MSVVAMSKIILRSKLMDILRILSCGNIIRHSLADPKLMAGSREKVVERGMAVESVQKPTVKQPLLTANT